MLTVMQQRGVALATGQPAIAAQVAQMGDGVGFTIHHMHQRLIQAQRLLPLDAREQFIQMGLCGLRLDLAALVNP